MKILVPIKQVPDPYRHIGLTPDGELDDTTVTWVMNPFDAVALEEAVLQRERGAAIEIVAVTVGPSAWKRPLGEALARGADRAIFVEKDQPAETGMIAFLLAAVARREQPDLILMGREATDGGAGETGPRLAALLHLPQATFAVRIEIMPSSRARVTRETDRGRETLDVTLPAVVTVDLHLNQPRLLSLYDIVQARDKPLERVPSEQIVPQRDARVSVIRLEPPPPRAPCRLVADVAELVAALRDEERLI